MKLIVLVLILFASSIVDAEEINNTKWLMVTAECPDAVSFYVDTYTYYNDCYAISHDAIVETGSYKMEDGYINLSNREYRDAGGAIFWNKNVARIKILVLSKQTLILEVDGKERRYRAASF